MGPELGSAIDHAHTHMFRFRAIVFGFDTESSLDEVCAAGLAKESVV